MEDISAIKEIVKANAAEIYKDSSQPSLRVLGKSLAQCVSLFATPVGRMAEIFEKNIHRYLDKLDGLKEEEIVSPDTRILVPILERLRYTDDEKVAEYYAQILATASTKEHAKKVMSTFIEILNRLSADEIKILEHIHSKNNVVNIKPITKETAKKYALPIGATLLPIPGGFPVIDINVGKTDDNSYSVIKKNFNLLPNIIKLNEPSNIHSYLDNMISLGLLERLNKQYALKIIYDSLKQDEYVESVKKSIKNGQTLKLHEDRIDITELGNKLLKLCSKDEIKK